MLYENEKETGSAYISRHNYILEKWIVLLVIPIENDWHYLATTKLSSLIRGKTSKHHGDYYLNCLYSFAKENSLNLKKKYIKVNLKIKIFMELFCQPKNDILQFNQYVKSDKIS